MDWLWKLLRAAKLCQGPNQTSSLESTRSPSSSNGRQATLKSLLKRMQKSIKGNETPMHISAQLLEAVLSFQGSGFFMLADLKTLRLVCKPFKTAVDHHRPFLTLALPSSNQDLIQMLQDCCHVLPAAVALKHSPGHPESKNYQYNKRSIQLCKHINAGLKELEIPGNYFRGLAPTFAEIVFPRLTALTSLGIHAEFGGVKMLEMLESATNLRTLKSLAFYGDAEPGCGYPLEPWPFENLSMLTRLHFDPIIPLSEIFSYFTKDSLQYLAELSISDRDFRNDWFGMVLQGQEFPDWPRLKKLVVRDLQKPQALQVIAKAPWFPQLTSLEFKNAVIGDQVPLPFELLSSAGELVELIFDYEGALPPVLSEIGFKKLKKLQISEHPYFQYNEDEFEDEYSLKNIRTGPLNCSKFPVLETLIIQTNGFEDLYDPDDDYVDNLGEIFDFSVPYASPHLKSVELKGGLGYDGATGRLLSKWLYLVPNLTLIGGFEYLYDLIFDGVPSLTSLTLKVLNCERRDPSEDFCYLAEEGGRYPDLKELVILVDHNSVDSSWLRTPIKAAIRGNWPSLQCLKFGYFEREPPFSATSIEVVWEQGKPVLIVLSSDDEEEDHEEGEEQEGSLEQEEMAAGAEI